MSSLIIKLALVHHYCDVVIVPALYNNSVSMEGLGQGNSPQSWGIHKFFFQYTVKKNDFILCC